MAAGSDWGVLNSTAHHTPQWQQPGVLQHGFLVQYRFDKFSKYRVRASLFGGIVLTVTPLTWWGSPLQNRRRAPRLVSKSVCGLDPASSWVQRN